MKYDKKKTKGNKVFWQAAGSTVAGFILTLVAIFYVDPEAHGNDLYNPTEIKGLVLFLGLFLFVAGIIIGLVSYLIGPVKPPEDKK